MEETAYKRLKDAWLSNNIGSSRSEPLILILPLAFLIFFACAFRPKFGTTIFEFLLLVIPITLNLTSLAYNPDDLLKKTILLWLIICCAKYFTTQSRLSVILNQDVGSRPSWITNFRASTNLVTIICILAVDLNIFSRKFAKTETYGFSLMDTGVGFYVVCHGLVHYRKRWTSDLWDIATLGTLGVLRTVSIQTLDYQAQVSEYGVHWNFFLTLCACRLVSSILSRIPISSKVLFMLSGLIHSRLTFLLGDWVVSPAPRTGFVAANREGLVSILGYVTIYYAAAAYRNFTHSYSVGNVFKKTAVLAVWLWLISYVLDTGPYSVSRRLCNIGYIIWILSMAASFLVALILIDITLKSADKPRVPQLLEMINRKAFLFFMIGNISTGIINLNIQTLLLTAEQSYCLLIVYEIVVVFLTRVIKAETPVYIYF